VWHFALEFLCAAAVWVGALMPGDLFKTVLPTRSSTSSNKGKWLAQENTHY